MKQATLSRKLRERQKITYKHLKLNRKEDKMKDINDIDKTIDWIDEEELTENERKFLEEGDCTTPKVRLDAAFWRIILNRTTNDLITKEHDNESK